MSVRPAGPAGFSARRPHALPRPCRRTACQRRPSADETARAIALALLEGFDRHYALFRECARAAQAAFRGRQLARDRPRRAATASTSTTAASLETAERIEREFGSAGLDGSGADALWERVKLHYIGLLIDHRQPECAETFFNSVSCKILHRTYFHNRFMFVRPAISTEHLDADPPTYRSYYPRAQRAAPCADRHRARFPASSARFADFRRDLRNLLRAFRRRAAAAVPARGQPPDPGARRRRSSATRPPTSSGASSTACTTQPFAVPIKHDAERQALRRCAAHGRRPSSRSCSRPTAPISWSTWRCRRRTSPSCARCCPTRPRPSSTRWSGLQKHGKTLFFRDFLHHLAHSRDRFIVAPGHQGPGDERCSRCPRIRTCSR